PVGWIYRLIKHLPHSTTVQCGATQSGSLDVFTYNFYQLLRSLIFCMLAEGTLLPSTGNCLPLVVVLEVIPNELHTLISTAVCYHLFTRRKQLVEVFFPVGHQERAHACCLIKAPIVGVRGKIPMLVKGDLGTGKNAIHGPSPCRPRIAGANRRVRGQMCNARRPDLRLWKTPAKRL